MKTSDLTAALNAVFASPTNPTDQPPQTPNAEQQVLIASGTATLLRLRPLVTYHQRRLGVPLQVVELADGGFAVRRRRPNPDLCVTVGVPTSPDAATPPRGPRGRPPLNREELEQRRLAKDAEQARLHIAQVLIPSLECVARGEWPHYEVTLARINALATNPHTGLGYKSPSHAVLSWLEQVRDSTGVLLKPSRAASQGRHAKLRFAISNPATAQESPAHDATTVQADASADALTLAPKLLPARPITPDMVDAHYAGELHRLQPSLDSACE